MTPMQALVAGTKNGAIESLVADELGTLEVGKYADVLILDADPLEDIQNLRQVHAVIRNGRRVDLESLPVTRVFTGNGGKD
jgi:imidazolonepropionase-like amidohydrolase